MKRLSYIFLLVPTLCFGKTYMCDAGNDIQVKFKQVNENSISASILKNKKEKSLCMFNARSHASDPRGVSETVVQNFQKVSCSVENLKLGEGMNVSDLAYTKIHQNGVDAYFFVFSGLQPLKCKALK